MAAVNHTLLAVFAHPDDETFLAGPTLASYASRGVEVHLCCATPEPPSSPSGYAARRRASVACAAAVLGIRRVHHLDLSEIALGSMAVDQLAARVRMVLDEVRAQVVLTDGAYGSYGHPHHILMHRAATAAVRGLPQDARPRLYAIAWPLTLVRMNERLLRLFGVRTHALAGRADLNLRAVLQKDHPITARLDVRPFVGARRRAAACYPAEIAAAPLPLRLLEAAPVWTQQIVFGQARFTRILPAEGPAETDLFAGP